MGIFRLILAIAVVIAHSRMVFYKNDESIFNSLISRDNTNIYILSGHAVFVFFIISGFLMSMVINEKYSLMQNGKNKFFINRALRLYPINIAILILMFSFYSYTGVASYINYTLPNQSLLLTIVSFFSNIFFLGAELITFNHNENWDYVNPQIWSLSIELYFYILAPFIVTKSIKLIFTLAFLSLCLRLFLYHKGFPPVPWRYFFFPSDLVFFLMGVLAHRTCTIKKYFKGIDAILCLRYLSVACVIFIIFYKGFWPLTRDFDSLSSWFFFILVAVSIPLLFTITKNNSVDSFLGHLSYPVYIGHMFVITIVYHFSSEQSDRGLITLLITLSMSILLYLMIDKP
ncbi:acyltransferase family protein, partial [Yersinia intermedia]|uniref:acyltransferase family protein n=1 Tax=Yersinia intermedia TaxID=631 RepID=UPI00119E94D3